MLCSLTAVHAYDSLHDLVRTYASPVILREIRANHVSPASRQWVRRDVNAGLTPEPTLPVRPAIGWER